MYVEGVKMNVKPENEKVKQFLSLTPVFWESPASFIERYRSAPVIMITAMSPLQKASGTMYSWMFHQSSYPWRTFFYNNVSRCKIYNLCSCLINCQWIKWNVSHEFGYFLQLELSCRLTILVLKRSYVYQISGIQISNLKYNVLDNLN